LKNLPPSIQAIFEGLKLEQMFVLYMTAFMLAPLFLIMPLMFSSVVGADSFVGERERKTMEALLYSPATDMELFLGKVLAAVIPAILAFVADVSGLHHRGQCCELQSVRAHLVPLPTWWPSDVLADARLCLLGISATVMISARVKTFMEAYQLTGSLVVLVLALVIGQVTGVLFSAWAR
jgi:ABC-2 type transport system permease protein